MADFSKAYDKILKNEGGYVNDPSDHGGETWAGISRKNFPDWFGWTIIDSYKGMRDFPEILNGNPVLELHRRNFYKKTFWNKVRGDEITNQEIAESILDSSVNFGTVQAIKLAQRSDGCNESGKMDDGFLHILNNQP